MTGMAKVYEREIDGALLDAYWLALRDWSLADFEDAAAQLMRTSKFMPRPADFNDLRKAGRPTPGEAWARALENVRSGGYRYGRGVDPLIDRAVAAIGGYGVIGMTDEDKLGYLERRFAEAYRGMEAADEAREAVPLIAGGGSFRPRVSGPQGVAALLERVKPS